ncbi:hypothetical protein [Amycolatopsis sp. NPDC051128]|uniref:hypothetical protein n=1 Tax=Amycolatopsis sp. NPDC051128 TaxID=3155412 RepID=UPI0034126D1B
MDTLEHDVNTWSEHVGTQPLRPGQLTVVPTPDGSPAQRPGGGGFIGMIENALDVEAVHGMAPKADIISMMMAQPRVTRARWMWSRVSQRIRRRLNQCGSASVPSTTRPIRLIAARADSRGGALLPVVRLWTAARSAAHPINQVPMCDG